MRETIVSTVLRPDGTTVVIRSGFTPRPDTTPSEIVKAIRKQSRR